MGHIVRRTVTGRRGKNRAATKARTTGKKEKSAIQTAIVPVSTIQGKRERTLRAEEIELLKNTVAKGTTNDEFLYFMTICRKHRIDPFTKQIYCVVWPTDGGKSHDLVIIMGIGGYRMTAARDHKDFAGTSSATFTWPEKPMKTPAGRTIPDSATVKAIRKGGEFSEATCYWEEFAPRDLTTKRSDFWNRLPKHMLAKCAEAHAIRKAFPDLSDIFTEEEVSQRLGDFTEGGRQIVDSNGVAPSGRPVTQAAQVNHQIAEEVDRQKEEGARRREGKADPQTIDMPAFKGSVEWDWTNEASPVIRGDVQEPLDEAKSSCHFAWGKDAFWHAEPRDFEPFAAICRKLRYELIVITPKKDSTAKKVSSAPKEQQKAAESSSQKKNVGGGGESNRRVSSPPAADVTIVTGVIEKCNAGMTSTNKPTRQVKIGRTWYNCYRNTIFEFLDRGVGKQSTVFIDKRMTLVGLKNIGTMEFEDGHIPTVQQKNRTGGTESLFK